MADHYASELEELIKKAQKEPGIADLLALYGQYGEVIKKGNEYLAGTLPKTIISTTAGTT